MTKIGERVLISPHELSLAAIARPMLPVPMVQFLPALPTQNTSPRVTAANLPVAGPKMLKLHRMRTSAGGTRPAPKLGAMFLDTHRH
jgi:hypothetical protein